MPHDISALITYYDKLKVYRADSYAGTYNQVGEITLLANQPVYYFNDNAGELGHFYRWTYYRTAGAIESEAWPLPVLYCTVADVKGRVNDGLSDDTEDRNYMDAVAAATDAINRYCGRKFNQVEEERTFSGSPSKGFYIGKGAQFLDLNDFVEISEIEVNYPAGPASISPAMDVYPLPENAAVTTWPYQQLAFKPGSSNYWPTGYSGTTITALWGWPVDPATQSPVPVAIREACIEIALRLYGGKANAYAGVKGQTDLGTQDVPHVLMGGDTAQLLQPYVLG